jgi:hypothetical protein
MPNNNDCNVNSYNVDQTELQSYNCPEKLTKIVTENRRCPNVESCEYEAM